MFDFVNSSGTLPPSDEGGGFLRSKKTEGEKVISISLPQSKAELLTAPSSEGANITIKLSARQTPIYMIDSGRRIRLNSFDFYI